MSERRLLCFNCSHEMALAANVKQFFPPKNVQQMEDDLCLLPLWWAEEGDAVIVGDVAEAEAFAARWRGVCPEVTFTTWSEGYASLRERAGRDFVPCPWGWNRAVAERFLRYGVSAESVPSDAELDVLRRLASREFVCGGYQNGNDNGNDDVNGNGNGDCFGVSVGAGFARPTSGSGSLQGVISELPVFCRSLDFGVSSGAGRLIFKSPWSSSGRGVFVSEVPLPDSATARLKGFLNTQGGFLVERFYDKRLDFALEFMVNDDATVDFLGFSVFGADESGRYGGNVLASQQKLRDVVEDCWGADVSAVVENARLSLGRSLGGRYVGIAGVDMMVVDDAGTLKVHPCVEVNLRMNMGVLAMKVYERLSASGIVSGDALAAKKETALTPERERGFMVKCLGGRLVVERGR